MCVGRRRMGCIAHRCWHTCGLPWSQPFVGNGCVLHVSVRLNSHMHILWWVIALMVCVSQQWMGKNTLIVIAKRISRSNMMSSTIRAMLADFKGSEMPICRSQCRRNLYSINKYNATWRHRNYIKKMPRDLWEHTLSTLQINFEGPQTQFIHIALMVVVKIWIPEICKLAHMF